LERVSGVKSEKWEAQNGADKVRLKGIYKQILDVTESHNKYEEVQKALAYLFNNWGEIEIRVCEASGCRKYCTESQFSHVLSARMSSRLWDGANWALIRWHKCGHINVMLVKS